MADVIRLEADGIIYRVLEARWRDGKLIAYDPGGPHLPFRAFRPKQGHRRLYRLKDAADRQVDGATLRRQLQQAEYLPLVPAGGKDQDPR